MRRKGATPDPCNIFRLSMMPSQTVVWKIWAILVTILRGEGRETVGVRECEKDWIKHAVMRRGAGV
jgi:hypothetical protein